MMALLPYQELSMKKKMPKTVTEFEYVRLVATQDGKLAMLKDTPQGLQFSREIITLIDGQDLILSETINDIEGIS